MTTGRINQITLMSAPSFPLLEIRTELEARQAITSAQTPRGPGPVFYTPWTYRSQVKFWKEFQKLTNARVSQLSSIPRQQSVSAVVWTPGSHQALKAALMLLPFCCTDPEQCVNPEPRLPKATNEPSKSVVAPGFHWFNQSWMARGPERVTGT